MKNQQEVELALPEFVPKWEFFASLEFMCGTVSIGDTAGSIIASQQPDMAIENLSEVINIPTRFITLLLYYSLQIQCYSFQIEIEHSLITSVQVLL